MFARWVELSFFIRSFVSGVNGRLCVFHYLQRCAPVLRAGQAFPEVVIKFSSTTFLSLRLGLRNYFLGSQASFLFFIFFFIFTELKNNKSSRCLPSLSSQISCHLCFLFFSGYRVALIDSGIYTPFNLDKRIASPSVQLLWTVPSNGNKRNEGIYINASRKVWDDWCIKRVRKDGKRKKVHD